MKDAINNEEKLFEIHRCEVCNGFGTLKFGSITCPACNGKRFIIINKKTGLPVEDREKDYGEQRLD